MPYFQAPVRTGGGRRFHCRWTMETPGWCGTFGGGTNRGRNCSLRRRPISFLAANVGGRAGTTPFVGTKTVSDRLPANILGDACAVERSGVRPLRRECDRRSRWDDCPLETAGIIVAKVLRAAPSYGADFAAPNGLRSGDSGASDSFAD